MIHDRPVAPAVIALAVSCLLSAANVSSAAEEARQTEEGFVRLFDIPTVAVPAFSPTARDVLSKACSEEILRLLERRPCTVEDIALGLGIPPAEAEKYVADLDAHGQVKRKRSNGAIYFTADPA